MEWSGPGDRSSEPRDIKYDSIGGRALVKQIVSNYLSYDPHAYVLDGVCPVMDGYDLLATTPCGSGKTTFFIILMLSVREISRDETLKHGKTNFPKDPVMIVVCPTKALEEDMVRAKNLLSFFTHV